MPTSLTAQFSVSIYFFKSYRRFVVMRDVVAVVRRKTIYEYHRVNFPKEDIKNWTVIHLKALPTCVENQDCETCLTRKIDNFQVGFVT